MLNNAGARRVVGVVIDPVARGLLRLHVPPDAVTIFGTVGACVGALVFFPQGKFLVGVLVIVAFIFSDLLDGTMARMSGTSGPWGNFLDATLDRVADGAVFGGLLLWTFFSDQSPWVVAAALTTLVAGQVISYAKARAEAVGATANTGIAERAERLIIALVAAFVAGCGVPFVLPAALVVLAVLSVVTVIQRMIAVRKQLWQRRA
jgi:CDP-diacylglycerol--glycerol-3-phosphate 3-phosphatidyltransferase